MLVISRCVQEELIIYDDKGLKITIVICGIKAGQVRIGIDARKDIHVDRKEIFLRKQAENAGKTP